jgi:lysophospholipase L1-like esterase
MLTTALAVSTSLLLPPDDKAIRYLGRGVVNSTVALFDWVGSGLELTLQGHNASVTLDMDPGGHVRFAVYTNGKLSQEFSTTAGRRMYELLPTSATSTTTALTLLKTSEPWTAEGLMTQPPAALFGVRVDGASRVCGACSAAQRTLEVYGDSDTASFGVDASATAWDDARCLAKPWEMENFAHGWVRRVHAALSVDETRVQAISGVGVVRNAAGAGAPMPTYVARSLQAVAADDYAPRGFRPSLVVIYLGSKDYTAQIVPQARAEFEAGYRQLVSRVLSFYSTPAPPTLHICGGEAMPCEVIEAVAASMDNATYSTTGDTGVPKGGCIGHRNASQQATLATRLAPVVAAAAGWRPIHDLAERDDPPCGCE